MMNIIYANKTDLDFAFHYFMVLKYSYDHKPGILFLSYSF